MKGIYYIRDAIFFVKRPEMDILLPFLFLAMMGILSQIHWNCRLSIRS